MSWAQTVTIKGHHLGETLEEFMQPGHSAQVTEQAGDNDGAYCRDSLALVRSGIRSGTVNVKAGNGHICGHGLPKESFWSFQEGKLGGIYLELAASYEEVRDEMTSKIGAAPVERLSEMQNNYGARWINRIAEWNTADIHAELKEDDNPAKGGNLVTLNVTRPQKPAAPHSSPLD